MPNYAYSNHEYLEMVICYREVGENLLQAQNLYFERYGRRLSRRTILGAVQRHRDFGIFNPPAVDAGRPRVSANLEEQVLDFFERHPMASTEDGARVFNLSRMYVWRVLREEGLYPYHFTKVQELMLSDYTPRVEFCRWLIEEPNRNILWTDESTFTRVGMFNIHNAHYWADANPRAVRPAHFQTRFSVNVWAGILGDIVLGPVFLDRLNAGTYIDLLSGDIEDMLDEVPLHYLSGIFYQHDGAPAHFARTVRDYLTAQYGERWIGRGGPVPWPARSPDLTPLDFYLWGRVKDLVYGNDGHTISSMEQLKTRIINAFSVVNDRDTLRRVQGHVIRRANVCIEQLGEFVQHLM